MPDAGDERHVDMLDDDAPQNATQAPPAALDARDQIALSAVNAVVSRIFTSWEPARSVAATG
jgi:hypothetical protein